MIDQQKLKEQVSGPNRSDQWQDYIMSEMRELRGQLAEEQAKRQEATVAVLTERLSILQEEQERLRTQSSQPVDQLGQAMNTLDTAKALMERMYPPEKEDKKP